MCDAVDRPAVAGQGPENGDAKQETIDFANWKTPSGKKPHLSASQITRLMDCGEFWRLKYIEKRKTPGTFRLAVGKTVHEVIASSLKQKIREGKPAPVEAIPDRARSECENHMTRDCETDEPTNSLAEWERQRGLAIDKAIGLSTLWALHVEAMIDPIEVEQRGKIVLDGFPFDVVVIKDIVTDDAIRDTKTSARAPQEDAADQSFQLALYALHEESMGRPAKRLVLDFLVATKAWQLPERKVSAGSPDAKHESLQKWIDRFAGTKLYYRAVETMPSPERRSLVLAMIERSAKVIESGAFMPNPASWFCSKRFCPFARSGECRFWSGKA